MKAKFYVGVTGSIRQVFTAFDTPTPETHGGSYLAVIGPFRTKRGADYMQKYGNNNPHCQCVADAERLAKLPESSPRYLFTL